ncbi:MAG: hypothetical protein AB7S75_22220 [Desulfococcaceae bacterium]
MREYKNIFEIPIELVQIEAEKIIRRRLTDDEIYSVKKGIEAGLYFDIETVIRTSIEDALRDLIK